MIQSGVVEQKRQFSIEMIIEIQTQPGVVDLRFHADRVADDGKFVKVFSWYDNEWGFSNAWSTWVVIAGKL